MGTPNVGEKLKRKRISLSSSVHIRREMVKVYADARAGIISASDMSKFVFALRTITETFVVTDLENMIKQLEEKSK